MLQKQKKLLVVANWKMTPATLAEASKKARSFVDISKKYKKTPKSNVVLQVLVCPPFPLISDIKNIFGNSGALVGAQDVSLFEIGSKTGEVSAGLISSIGASYSIVGHSERRAMGDTDDIVAIKLGQVLSTKMSAIVCIGESERDADGAYLEVIKKQLKSSLARMSNSDFARLVIAYEPVWAIGKKDNIALTGHELHQMVIYIRKVLRDLYNDTIASSVKILYGGSVNSANSEDIIWNGEVDGLLIGRASFEPKSYEEICQSIVLPTISEGNVKNRQKISDLKNSLKNRKKDSVLHDKKEVLAKKKISKVGFSKLKTTQAAKKPAKKINPKKKTSKRK